MRWFTCAEVGALIGRDKSTVSHWAKTGRIRATNIGTELRPAYRISQKAIDEFMTERQVA